MQVEVVSPERILWSGEGTQVLARTLGGGEIVFMTGHAPFVGALDIGKVVVWADGAQVPIAVHGGFVEVSNNKVTILSDVAELAGQIAVERARRALGSEDPDAVKRAEVRLAVAGAPTTSASAH
jgi:F-type H+-transporting ATPase subunit epsilon